MTAYDDHLTSCPGCSVGLDPDDLCGCDDETGPLCVRCCTAEHGRAAA